MKNSSQNYYKIYNDSDDVLLSRRQAECVAHLLYGRTIRKTAQALGISVRTVEYYLFNIRKKLDCASKNDVIAKIANSDFRETAASIFEATK